MQLLIIMMTIQMHCGIHCADSGMKRTVQKKSVFMQQSNGIVTFTTKRKL